MEEPNYITVGEAILDLPKLNPGEGVEKQDILKPRKMNDYLKRISSPTSPIYNHVARKHNDLDRERYRILSANKNWQLKDLQKIRPDLIHHDPKHFGNRYTVQESNKPGKTVVAHLYKDGNRFIHYDSKQSRTITVREAARLQSFDDDFDFVGAQGSAYQMIGNAVPPQLAKRVALALSDLLEEYLND